MDTLWGSFMNYLVLYVVVDEVRTVFVNGATSRPPSNQRDFAVGRETFAHTIWLFCGIRSENSFSTKAWGLEKFLWMFLFSYKFFFPKLGPFLWRYLPSVYQSWLRWTSTIHCSLLRFYLLFDDSFIRH